MTPGTHLNHFIVSLSKYNLVIYWTKFDWPGKFVQNSDLGARYFSSEQHMFCKIVLWAHKALMKCVPGSLMLTAVVDFPYYGNIPGSLISPHIKLALAMCTALNHLKPRNKTHFAVTHISPMSKHTLIQTIFYHSKVWNGFTTFDEGHLTNIWISKLGGKLCIFWFTFLKSQRVRHNKIDASNLLDSIINKTLFEINVFSLWKNAFCPKRGHATTGLFLFYSLRLK